MRISLSWGELTTEQRETAARRGMILKSARAKVRSASLAVERGVKSAMPVDTGRARASWGHWSPGDTNNPDASAADALWEEGDEGLSITQGTNVEYVKYLNEGHSSQAPAGFIDLQEEKGQAELDRQIDDLMQEF
jgi:hypothetical protein